MERTAFLYPHIKSICGLVMERPGLRRSLQIGGLKRERGCGFRDCFGGIQCGKSFSMEADSSAIGRKESVQNSIKNRLERWKIRRGINSRQNQSFNFRCSPQENFYRNVPRGSCISFATSMSFVNRSPSVPAINRLENYLPPPESYPMKDDVV
ncbi:diuretic hormone receptor [Trichonephila clavipes]|nr:diuretic hormone receptor [Trichonephila clavipes]